MTAFSKAELRQLFTHLGRLLPPGGRPLGAADVVDVQQLLEKIRVMAAEAASLYERGRLVMTWRLDPKQAPTLNTYAFMKTWQRKRLRGELDQQLREIIGTKPGIDLCGARKKRWLRITRFTTQPKKIDEHAADAVGGKMPIDSLTRLGVIADDTPQFLHREVLVAKTEKGNTHVFLEVFEVALEGDASTAAPVDAPYDPAPAHELGELTKFILGKKG